MRNHFYVQCICAEQQFAWKMQKPLYYQNPQVIDEQPPFPIVKSCRECGLEHSITQAMYDSVVERD